MLAELDGRCCRSYFDLLTVGIVTCNTCFKHGIREVPETHSELFEQMHSELFEQTHSELFEQAPLGNTQQGTTAKGLLKCRAVWLETLLSKRLS